METPGSLGSPPRVRGKVSLAFDVGFFFGITPARAGKSSCASGDRFLVWDHPRACGEKGLQAPLQSLTTGSPPRVRGKVQELDQAGAMDGITPARAGKRLRIYLSIKKGGDHPRACGEKTLMEIEKLIEKGSPPRVRGKVQNGGVCVDGLGITPARAGKSPGRSGHRRQSGDHPRACGEKDVTQTTLTSTVGSPPRVRGKVFAVAHFHAVERITPARAGKSYGTVYFSVWF